MQSEARSGVILPHYPLHHMAEPLLPSLIFRKHARETPQQMVQHTVTVRETRRYR
jgi:hypothetical protein